MNPLTRSSTTIRSPSSTQTDRRGDKPARLRIRSSSFSIRRQRSDSHFNEPVGHNLNTSNLRRPSFESRTLVHEEQQQPPVQLSEEANSSLLTVSDGHNGGAASSVDSVGSDDEEEYDNYRFNKELPELVQSPSELDNSKPLERQKSITSSFKDKLHLSSPIRAKSMFDGIRGFHHHHQQQHRNVSTPVVYYDGMSSPQHYDADRSVLVPPSFIRIMWTSNFTSCRDAYGFVKGTQWVSVEEYDAFQRSYQPIAARRLVKWRQLLAEHNNHWPQPSSKCKFYF